MCHPLLSRLSWRLLLFLSIVYANVSPLHIKEESVFSMKQIDVFFLNISVQMCCRFSPWRCDESDERDRHLSFFRSCPSEEHSDSQNWGRRKSTRRPRAMASDSDAQFKNQLLRLVTLQTESFASATSHWPVTARQTPRHVHMTRMM